MREKKKKKKKKKPHYRNGHRLRLLIPTESRSQEQGYDSDGNHSSVDNEIIVNFAHGKKNLELTSEDEKEVEFQQGNVHLEPNQAISNNPAHPSKVV
jgi:hypothetical protein